MISELKIGNFKAFGPAQTIPLRPITLVFGPNSAGKSSIIQSLLLARHIHDTGKADAHQTTLGGNAVDLGGFAQYVHGHNGALQTSIQFAFIRSKDSRQFHFLNKSHTVRITYAIGVDPADPANPRIVIRSVTFGLDDCELLHFIRSGSGDLHVDETALFNRSQFALGELWMQGDFADILDEPETAGPFTRKEVAARAAHQGAARPLTKTLQRYYETRPQHKEAVVEEIRGMKFRATSLALENLGDLLRENPDWETFASNREMDRPEGDPIGFYKRHLETNRDFVQEKGDPGRLSDPQIEAKAWAMALRYDIECLIETASNAVEKGMKRLSYLGPLRCIPPRHLLETDEFDASWVAGGGDAWQRLRKEPAVVEKVNRFLRETLRSRYTIQTRNFASQLDDATLERCIREAMKKANDDPSAADTDELAAAKVAEDPPFPASNTSSAEKLATALKAELSSQNAGETLTELQLFDAEAGIEVSHRDVGTGISQLLPVVVSAVASEGKLITIEQPELHLHPALQAELGDVFVESALGENKNSFLIETHSEHLILRILRRIRETSESELPEGLKPIRPEDVCVLYIEPGKDGSRAIHLPVNAEGDFDKPWPDGFFPERAKELF